MKSVVIHLVAVIAITVAPLPVQTVEGDFFFVCALTPTGDRGGISFVVVYDEKSYAHILNVTGDTKFFIIDKPVTQAEFFQQCYPEQDGGRKVRLIGRVRFNGETAFEITLLEKKR